MKCCVFQDWNENEISFAPTIKEQMGKDVIEMKVVIQDGCIGCGMCEGTCPEVFRIGDDGLAQVYAEVDSSTEETAVEAANGCPVSVIEVEY